MDSPSNCDDLLEIYGWCPQAIPATAWRFIFPKDKAEFCHTYYSRPGAPTLVSDGFELEYHPMWFARELHNKKEKAKAWEAGKENILNAIWPDEPSEKSEQPPSS